MAVLTAGRSVLPETSITVVPHARATVNDGRHTDLDDSHTPEVSDYRALGLLLIFFG